MFNTLLTDLPWQPGTGFHCSHRTSWHPIDWVGGFRFLWVCFFLLSLFPSLPTHPFLVFLQHSVDLSKGCVIIRFSDWPQLPMQARADKSRRANPGAQLAKAAGGQVGMNGASALPPAPRTWQSRCLAPCERVALKETL